MFCFTDRKEPKDMKAPEKAAEHLEGTHHTFLLLLLSIAFRFVLSSNVFLLSLGCYFEGDQKMHAPGTTWHPFVPPFGYIKCAVCTCKVKSHWQTSNSWMSNLCWTVFPRMDSFNGCCYTHRGQQERFTVKRWHVQLWPAATPWGVTPLTAVRNVPRRIKAQPIWSTATWCRRTGRDTANLARTITRTVTTGTRGFLCWERWSASTAGVM